MRQFNSFSERKKLFLLGIIIAATAATLDLYSKYLIFDFLDEMYVEQNLPSPQLQITSFFNLVKVWNRGVSFGMFHHLESAKYIILLVNITILIILFFWLYNNKSHYLTWAIGLIIGGALGNIIDRIYNSAVADFLDFYIGKYHWPAFNIADSCVFIGVVLLLFENVFAKKIKDKK